MASKEKKKTLESWLGWNFYKKITLQVGPSSREARRRALRNPQTSRRVRWMSRSIPTGGWTDGAQFPRDALDASTYLDALQEIVALLLSFAWSAGGGSRTGSRAEEAV